MVILLGGGQNPEFRKEMTQRIVACEPQNWFTEEEFEQRLGLVA